MRRRAVFFDVEKTSRAQHIDRVIRHLALGNGGARVEIFALGNWRIIGEDTAHLLALPASASSGTAAI